MRLFGFGKDVSFYLLLEAQAEAANRAALQFRKLADDFSELSDLARSIEAIENEADDLMHQLSNKIDATFVTPLDKEDLHGLSSKMDDITDAIEDAVGSILLYRLTAPRADVVALADTLIEITVATQEAVGALRHMGGREAFQPLFIRIHQAENKGDTLYRKAIADLFNAPNPDPLMVIKWKEIYDRIEAALDSCEQAANVIESIVVKYA